jgi:hypothetical protein
VRTTLTHLLPSSNTTIAITPIANIASNPGGVGAGVAALSGTSLGFDGSALSGFFDASFTVIGYVNEI